MVGAQDRHPRTGALLVTPKSRVGRIVLGVLLLGALTGGATLWRAFAGADAVLRTIPLSISDAAGAITVDEHTERAIVVGGGRPTTLSLIDTQTGTLLRAVDLGGGSGRAVAVAAGHAFVLEIENATRNTGTAGTSGIVSMLDTRTGALMRVVRVPQTPTVVTVDEQGGHVFVASEGRRKGFGNTLGAGTLSMLDARTGALIRRVPLGIHPVTAAVDGRTRRVFVVNGGPIGRAGLGVGAVTVLNADTGGVLRTVMVGQGAGAIAVDERTARVFVANEGSHDVSILDARTGTVLLTVGVGFPRDVAVDERAGRVVVANGAPGTVSLLDATSGVVLHTLDVGGDPDAVAVDARTRRAFVTGTGTNNSLYRQLRSIGLIRAALPNDYGYVTILDTLSGRILRTVHIGPSGTKGVAVDGHTGHAFVTNLAGNSVSMLNARL